MSPTQNGQDHGQVRSSHQYGLRRVWAQFLWPVELAWKKRSPGRRTWSGRIRERTKSPGFSRREAIKHLVQTVVSERGKEMFDVRSRKSFERHETQCSILRYTRAPKLSLREFVN